MDLPAGLLDPLSRPSPSCADTLRSDGSLRMTQTWVDDDGTGLIRIDTAAGSQVVEDRQRDARVALDVTAPADPSRCSAVRGRDRTRLVVSIEADRFHSAQG